MEKKNYYTEAAKAKARARYLANKEEILARGKAYRKANPEKCKQWKKSWREKNPEKFRIMMRDSKKRSRLSPKGRIGARIRERLREHFGKGTSLASLEKKLGYTMEQLKQHIERQFMAGMTWENRAKWHIDHIIPLSSFNYSSKDDPEFRAAWALTNLRPLWAIDNARKGAKRTVLI